MNQRQDPTHHTDYIAFSALVDEGHGPFPEQPWIHTLRHRIFIAATDGSVLTPVSADHQMDDALMPLWDPDGFSLTYLVVARDYTRSTRYRTFLDQYPPTELPVTETPEAILQRTYGYNQVYASPDHRLFAVTKLDDAHLYGFQIVSPDNEVIAVCAATYAYVGGPRWSPDGSFIAFTAADDDEGTTSSLYVLNWLTGTIQRVCGEVFEETFVWSPDNDHLAVAHYAEREATRVYAVSIIDRAGTRQHFLCDVNKGDVSGVLTPALPAWSSDGQYVAVSTLTKENAEIDLFTGAGRFFRCLEWASPVFASIDDLAWRPSLRLS